MWLMCLCMFISCSSVPEEREITVSDVEITGFIKDYVKVVDGTYKFTQNGDDAFISVKLELIRKPLVGYDTQSWAQLRLNPVGEGGEIFDTGIYGFTTGTTEFDKVEDLLKADVGDTKNVAFKWDYFGLEEDKIGKDIFEKAVSFEIIDNGFELTTGEEENEGEGEVASVVASTESSSTDEWDAVLDDYEDYYDQYIKLLEKAKDGDISAMTEYVEMLEKAQSLGEKLSKAQGDLTAKQVSRFMKIQQKLLNAAADL